ncbi:hypothetical protein TNCV_2509481 [Trichonephila clavipes]|nr:hypothetical protein TNCV_2509481 [Trichonephila clavipes]
MTISAIVLRVTYASLSWTTGGSLLGHRSRHSFFSPGSLTCASRVRSLNSDLHNNTEADRSVAHRFSSQSYAGSLIAARFPVSHVSERRKCAIPLVLHFNFALFSYSRAFGYRPRNFESWSSDKDDTLACTPLS